MDLLVAFVLGASASALAWLAVARGFRPAIEWAPAIGVEVVPGRALYRAGIRNRQRRWLQRSIFDVTVSAVVRVPQPGDRHHASLLALSVIPSSLPRLSGARFIRLTAATSEFARELEEAGLSAAGNDDLREFLDAHPGSGIRIYVSGNDSFSGSRRVFWRDYSVTDFLAGPLTFEAPDESALPSGA